MPTFEAYSPQAQHVLQALRSGHPVEGDEEVTERVSTALWRFEETITANANNLPDNETGEVHRRFHRPGPKSVRFRSS